MSPVRACGVLSRGVSLQSAAAAADVNVLTMLRFPAPGTYRVWVRTRDGVAPGQADDARRPTRAHGRAAPISGLR